MGSTSRDSGLIKTEAQALVVLKAPWVIFISRLGTSILDAKASASITSYQAIFLKSLISKAQIV